MKKQIICLMFIIVLIASTFQNVSSSSINDNSKIYISSSIVSFSEATLEEQDAYLSVKIDGMS